MCTIAMIIWAIFHSAGERALHVPSTAMAPTLIIGDTIAIDTNAAGNLPARGQVIAFADPSDPRTVQVFRVIGLAGDVVRLEAGVVILNGVPLPREAMGETVVDFGYELQPAAVWRETLPDGAVYDTLDAEPEGFLDTTGDFAVPAGHVFVLGDNRDNANDSRGTYGGMGYVPVDNVIGRVATVIASCAPDGLFVSGRTGLVVGP
jgi:signal peptidase I